MGNSLRCNRWVFQGLSLTGAWVEVGLESCWCLYSERCKKRGQDENSELQVRMRTYRYADQV